LSSKAEIKVSFMIRFFKIILCCLALLQVAVPVYAQQATAFSVVITDLPLMDDMVEDEADDFVFDKAEGRILQTSAIVSDSMPAEIEAFYAVTLPQMGWARVSDHDYRRAGEVLHIQTERIGSDTGVQFSVRPQ
jgi:hypothetical protein